MEYFGTSYLKILYNLISYQLETYLIFGPPRSLFWDTLPSYHDHILITYSQESTMWSEGLGPVIKTCELGVCSLLGHM